MQYEESSQRVQRNEFNVPGGCLPDLQTEITTGHSVSMNRLLIVFACLLASFPVEAQEQSVKPGINKEYHGHVDVDRYEKQFESQGREAYDRRNDIVGALKLQPGMKVADVGTGTGLFVPLFSAAVGADGRVYAVDISPEFVDHVKSKAAELGLKNVDTVLCTDRSVKLPPESIDLAFLCDVYHHFEYPRDSLASIRTALRPGGSLVVVDYQREPGKTPDWRLTHVRAGKAQVESEIAAAGFEKIEDLSFLKENYFVRFRKPLTSAATEPRTE